MKKVILLLAIFATANAKAQCYKEVVIAPTYEKVTENVEISPEYTKTIVIPAKFKTEVVRSYGMKPKTSTTTKLCQSKPVKCLTETQTMCTKAYEKKILVEPEQIITKTIPAVYAPITWYKKIKEGSISYEIVPCK